MSTFVVVNTYSHSVTYVTDNILRCLQDIVRQSGLNPNKIASDWDVLERGIKKWIDTRDLEELSLEVYNPKDDKLIGRWDFTIYYGYTDGSGSFYVDTDQIKWAIRKAGVWPGDADYRIVADTKAGQPDVYGWSSTTYRSAAGFVKQSIGTTVEGAGLSAGASFWRPL
jgi:hypothetical protein